LRDITVSSFSTFRRHTPGYVFLFYHIFRPVVNSNRKKSTQSAHFAQILHVCIGENDSKYAKARQVVVFSHPVYFQITDSIFAHFAAFLPAMPFVKRIRKVLGIP
jgi:hypothetical protein